MARKKTAGIAITYTDDASLRRVVESINNTLRSAGHKKARMRVPRADEPWGQSGGWVLDVQGGWSQSGGWYLDLDGGNGNGAAIIRAKRRHKAVDDVTRDVYRALKAATRS